ncbi:hypothetical protein ACFFK0_16390 [Paenibacillus chartarius]|uniref:Chemotaxis methyl-accepting receptor HlyB-like 4HB MCP domain-containing protein n=1 Tax=Paenibacillus chartarius TaxID=747481 RepID=A0ABV6DMY3_9BACL
MSQQHTHARSTTSKLVSLFAPGEAVMNRLKYVNKFLMIGLLFAIPLIVLSYLQYSDRASEVKHIQEETTGVEYVQKLNDFYYAVDTRRASVSAVVLGDSSLKETLVQAEAKADSAAAAIDKLDGEIGKQIQTTDKWNAVKKKWSDLKAKGTALTSQESIDQHASVITDTRSLMTHITNTSGLVLDGELGSYYLMDASVKQMPLLLDRAGRARALAVAYAAAKTPTAAEIRTLTTLLDQIKTTQETIKSDLDTAAQVHSDIGAKLQEAYTANSAELDHLIEYVNS